MANEIAIKMDQSKELAFTTTKVEQPVQVMMKDLKKVAQGKRLAEYNHRKKEKLAQAAKAQESEPNLSQASGVGAVIAAGALGLLRRYKSLSKKGDNNFAKVTLVRSVEVQTQKRTN